MAAISYPALLEGLRAMFVSGGQAPLRHHHIMRRLNEPDATLLLMPAWMDGKSYGGVKIVNVHPGNSERSLAAVSATYLLFDEVTGKHLALLDGAVMTARRTAAASALAATYLARKDAKNLLIVGAGTVAEQLAHAYRAAIPSLEKITIWNRNLASAEKLAAKLAEAGITANCVRELVSAVDGTDIITCATLSNEPIIKGEWLKPGQHLDLIGGFTPEMREADDEAIRRSRVFVDTEAAKVEAGDICIPIASGILKANAIAGDLYGMCRETAGRRSVEEITLFKSAGSAIEDLAAAMVAMKAQ